MKTSSATHVRWDDMPRERLAPLLERRFITGEHVTLAQFFLARGCKVARHSHINEQMAQVLKGKLRFHVGPELAEQVDVGAGEVLVIPPEVPHEVEALEDSVVSDVFSPIRQDWVERRDDYLRR
jgi:quercetin dioxygenase-like cupin family protein